MQGFEKLFFRFMTPAKHSIMSRIARAMNENLKQYPFITVRKSSVQDNGIKLEMGVRSQPDFSHPIEIIRQPCETRGMKRLIRFSINGAIRDEGNYDSEDKFYHVGRYNILADQIMQEVVPDVIWAHLLKATKQDHRAIGIQPSGSTRTLQTQLGPLHLTGFWMGATNTFCIAQAGNPTEYTISMDDAGVLGASAHQELKQLEDNALREFEATATQRFIGVPRPRENKG